MSDVEFDFHEFEKFAQRFQKMASSLDEFCRDISQQLAAELLRKCIKRTPVGQSVTQTERGKARTVQYRTKDGKKKFHTVKGKKYTFTLHHGGTLRRGWAASAVRKEGDTYVVEVSNSVLYAAYVEYGHRQEPGRFVPAIGKRLKKSWVPGKFMMTISTNEVQNGMEAKIEHALAKYMEQMLDGK
jgi:hypothetical protein